MGSSINDVTVIGYVTIVRKPYFKMCDDEGRGVKTCVTSTSSANVSLQEVCWCNLFHQQNFFLFWTQI